MDQQVDVVVVGAGPVGLLTAIELTLGGARVLVLERLAAASLDMKSGGHRRRGGTQLRGNGSSRGGPAQSEFEPGKLPFSKSKSACIG
jgi:glycine/D-amino acid oxidase-like deaminating enzyme